MAGVVASFALKTSSYQEGLICSSPGPAPRILQTGESQPGTLASSSGQEDTAVVLSMG